MIVNKSLEVNSLFVSIFSSSEKNANLRIDYARNFKFGMKVAPNKKSKKIMLNNQWLSWLPRGVITNFKEPPPPVRIGLIAKKLLIIPKQH